jgi:hypothetical protein
LQKAFFIAAFFDPASSSLQFVHATLFSPSLSSTNCGEIVCIATNEQLFIDSVRAQNFLALVSSVWPSSEPLINSAVSTAVNLTTDEVPVNVANSPNCTFSDAILPDWYTASPTSFPSNMLECNTQLQFAITTGIALSLAMGKSLQSSLCSAAILAIENCFTRVSIVSLSKSSSGSYISIVGVTTYESNLTDYVDEDVKIITRLVRGCSEASVLSQFRITQVTLQSVVLFTGGDTSTPTYQGTPSECLQQIWYLLFLILLVPFAVVILRYCYRKGKRRGINNAREDFEEETKKTLKFLEQQRNRHFGFPPPSLQIIPYEQRQDYNPHMQFAQSRVQ